MGHQACFWAGRESVHRIRTVSSVLNYKTLARFSRGSHRASLNSAGIFSFTVNPNRGLRKRSKPQKGKRDGFLTQTFHNVVELIDVGVSWEERLSREHFGHQAANGPHVNSSAEGNSAPLHRGVSMATTKATLPPWPQLELGLPQPLKLRGGGGGYLHIHPPWGGGTTLDILGTTEVWAVLSFLSRPIVLF